MRISIFALSTLLTLTIIMILLVLSYFGNNVNNVGFLIFLAFMSAIFFFKPIEIVNNLLFFIIIIPMLVGGYFIEQGAYLFEIDAYSYWNGSFLVNLFFCIAFIGLLVYPVKASKYKSNLNISHTYIEIVIIIALFILYGTFISTGVPILNGIHRSVYFSSMVPDYVNLIKGRLSFVCLVLGYYYFMFKRKKYLIYFFLVVLYHILCSIKGGELLIVIYAFFLPMSLYFTARYTTQQKKTIYKKIRLLLLLLVTGVFAIVFINYQTVENYDSGTTALQKVEKRIEAAGQIWWAINDERQVPEKFRLDKFLNNFESNDLKYDQGMNQLMNEVVPKKYLDSWRDSDERGRSLANGFPAIGYYYFGYIGVTLFVLILGVIIIWIKKDILTTFESGDILSFLFIGPLLEVIIRIVAQGDIHLLFELRTFAILAAYMLYGVIKSAVFRMKPV